MKLAKFINLIIVGFLIIATSKANQILLVDSMSPSASDSKLIVTDDVSTLSDIKVLAIIGNEFGDAYFWVKKQFESWGCNFTTIGLYLICSSCPHKPQRPVSPELLISEITEEILQQFDAVYVPAGAHWVSLLANSAVKNLLSDAYNLGLVVSGVCIGTKIIAAANGIVAGTKVVYYSQSNFDMQNAGAIIVQGTGIVSDNRIITAGTGTCGSTNPYIYQFCVAIAKAVKGFSAVIQSSIISIVDSKNNFTVTVETNDLTDTFYDNISTAVIGVKAIITWENDPTDTTTFTLSEISDSSIFTGNFTNLEKGVYTIELEIKSAGYGVEVVREAITFKVNSLGFIFCTLLLGLICIVLHFNDKKKQLKK
ncbi:MAG: DJ-1/PfpI family protein [Candidatus Heimdallarchaeota archaeon]